MAGSARGFILHEPLLGDQRLDHRVAAVAVPTAWACVLDLRAGPRRLQVLHELLAALEAVQPRVGARPRSFMVPSSSITRTTFEVVAQAHLEVVGVVGRGDLHRAGAERRVDEGVGDDRDLAAR